MKKLIIILTSILGILAIIAIIVLVVVSKKSAHLTITTSKGTVSATNFIQKAPYVYTGGATLESNANYAISYDAPNQTFNIVITSQPLTQYRQIAESKFIQDLGISQADACKLNVMLGTTAAIDPLIGGHNFGLSFCSNGIPFPANE